MSLKLNSGQVGLPSLVKEGVKHLQGTEEAVLRNIMACKALTEITRSSFGPNGLNKLVVNNLEKLFLTNDAGTIMRELEVEHPAAKLILMASQQQEREYGDGTNLVVLLAGELLKGAEELLRLGIKPAQIVEGYEMAYKHALQILDKYKAGEGESVGVSSSTSFKPIVSPVIGSKQQGWEGTLTKLVMEAVDIAKGTSVEEFNPENVRCVKILGGSIPMSSVIAGMVLEREPFGRVHQVRKAKIAIFACPINISRTETKGTVLITGAKELMDFSKGEETILQGQIQAIAASGVNVIVTGESVGELAMHFIERAGMMVLKVPSKFDLRRLCKAVGATPLARLGAVTEEEAGFCDLVETIEVGGTRCTVFRQAEAGKSRLATILLRSNTQSVLDDVERVIEDALFVVKAAGKDSRLIAGASAAEMHLARQLTTLAEITPGIAQYAIRKYAEAFEVVPRVLATNSGQESTETIAKLYWAHNQGNMAGVLIEGGSDDMVVGTAVVEDLVSVKRSAVHLATEAALTVLRVDQIIMSRLVGGPKARPAGPQDADD